jgi:hypothetical protein
MAQRCYDAAARRGKNASCIGCMQDLQKEFREYWNAVDKRRKAVKIDVLTEQINTLSDYDFSALYEAHIHNTQEDELADIIITCATWYRAAELAEEGSFNAQRSFDMLLASGAINFVLHQTSQANNLAAFRKVLNLKMKFNEVRED